MIEDTEELREFLVDALRDRGFDVEEAVTADEAIHKARQCPFDLVVTDVRLEGKDGLEALRDIKGSTPEIQSLVITGYASEADSIRAVQLGAGDYLKKPFGLEEFVQTVSRLVSKVWEERKAARRDSATLDAALWALCAVAETLSPELPLLAQRAEDIAKGLGFSEQASRIAQVMVMLEALAEEEVVGLDRLRPLLDELVSDAPELTRSLVDAVMIEAGRRSGEVDEAIKTSLQNVDNRVRPFSGDSDFASWVTLAEALEQRGDLVTALKTYEELQRDAVTNEQRVTVASRLARVYGRLGQAKPAIDSAAEAVKRARDIGPVAATAATIESGLRLLDLAPAQAVDFLKEGGQKARELHLECELAIARLGLVVLGEGDVKYLPNCLKVLRQPRFGQALASAAPWLLPFLLAQPAAEESERALQLLLTLRSDYAAAILTNPEIPEATRLRLLEIIESHSLHHLYTAVLGSLSNCASEALRSASAGLLRTPLSASVSGSVLVISSLGPFVISRNGSLIDERAWGSQKIKFLLALLVSRPGRLVSDDLILETFWPRCTPEKGRISLNQACTRIRRNLRNDDLGPAQKIVLKAPGGLVFDPEVNLLHDYIELVDCLKKGEERYRKDPIEAMAVWREILKFPDADYLDGCYHDFAIETRADLTRQLESALRKLAALSLQQGEPEVCLESSRRVLSREPCCQDSHAAVMQAQLKLGRPEQALRQYQICEKALRHELELEPATSLIELRERAKLMM